MSRRRPQEHHVYLLLVLSMSCAYLLAAFFFRKAELFGFNQLRRLGRPGAITALAIAAVAAALLPRTTRRLGPVLARLRSGLPGQPFLGRFLVAVLSSFLFFSFRNGSLNVDGEALIGKFHADVPVKGAYVTHDEMLEFYVHSRLWDHAHRRLGWTVEYTYQVTSAVAGGLFVFLLLSWTGMPGGPPRGLLPGLLSGGFMQLFFGDVENYTLVTLLIVLYVVAAELFVQGKVGVVLPSAVLALAMCFHLLAGWLLPSLLYLHVVAVGREGWRGIVVGGLAFAAILASTLIFFHFHHLPLRNLYYESHAFGHGGDFAGMLAPLSSRYYFRLLNLLFLLFPSALMLVPLLAYGRIGRETFGVFLAVAAASMSLFMLVWRSKIGVYNDWNLFAPAALVIAILCWRSFLAIEGLAHKATIFLWSVLSASLHTYTWILSNHR